MGSVIKRAAGLVSVVFAYFGNSPAVALNLPTFFARHDYVGYFAQSVHIADINGDGIPDIVASQQGYIQVLLGNGNGTFRSGPTTLENMRSVDAFIIADLNGDGKADLVLAGGTLGAGPPQGIGVCLGNGDGTFQPVVFYQAGNEFGANSLVLGDFNGDGIPDVVALGESGIWLFTGKGGGTFNPGVLAVPLATSAGRIAAADFNDDSKLDLVVTLPQGPPPGTGNGFAVVLGNGDGTFQPPQPFAEPKSPRALVVGNLTRGGHPSIVLSADSSAYLYFGKGDGSFSGPRVVSLPGSSDIAIGDVNGDGIPDLVASGGYICFGAGGGTFTSPFSYPVDITGGNFNVVLADLRNNGLTDIVTDSQDAISVLLSRGKGSFVDGEWLPITGGAACGATADFNRDGKPDLAVNTPAGVMILLGTGNANAPFTAGVTLAMSNAGCPLVGDLNGDGIPDLLATTPTAVMSYLSNGDGTFTEKSSTPVGPGAVVFGDFNHDGKLDFATSGNQLALGNGDGTFQAPTPIVANVPLGGFYCIAAADINRDGWSDLVLCSFYDPVFVLLNNQQGGFTQVSTNFGQETDQAILTDINGDGNPDLVIAGIGGGGNYIYLGDGHGKFVLSATLMGPAGSGLEFDMVADLNGDGIPDVAVMGSGTIAIYLGKGGGTYATPFYIGTGPSPGQILVGNLHGQLPSAGRPDIIVPDLSGGAMVLLNLTK